MEAQQLVSFEAPPKGLLPTGPSLRGRHTLGQCPKTQEGSFWWVWKAPGKAAAENPPQPAAQMWVEKGPQVQLLNVLENGEVIKAQDLFGQDG